jgi:hypothetical protein
VTTVADTNTAFSALTAVVTDLIPQATSAANAASAQKLQGAITACNIAISYCRDVSALVVGF